MGSKPLLSMPWGSLKEKLHGWMKHPHPWLAKAQRPTSALHHVKVLRCQVTWQRASREDGWQGSAATAVCIVTSTTALPCTAAAGGFCQPRAAAPSFTGATHIPGLTQRCCNCLVGRGISPHPLLQIYCLVAELEHCFSCFNNDKATLASQIKVSPTSSSSERNVCMHRYYMYMLVLVEVWRKLS